MLRVIWAAVLCSLLGACSNTPRVSDAGVVVHNNGKPFGIDISHYSNVRDWNLLKDAHVHFVFVKATQGLTYVDPTFKEHFQSAKQTGVIRGAYHFYETKDDGVGQADWFIENVQLEKGDLPPVVDIEALKGIVPDKTLHDNFNAFIERVEAHYGSKLIIYTGTSFWEHSMREHLPGHALWIAEYGVESPKIPSEWQSWTFWQFTESQPIAGAERAVDGSFFNGNFDEFNEMLIH